MRRNTVKLHVRGKVFFMVKELFGMGDMYSFLNYWQVALSTVRVRSYERISEREPSFESI